LPTTRFVDSRDLVQTFQFLTAKVDQMFGGYLRMGEVRIGYPCWNIPFEFLAIY